MDFLADTAIVVGRIVLEFHCFCLVWLVLLPVLPGPPAPKTG
jgi:hypothetical protein